MCVCVCVCVYNYVCVRVCEFVKTNYQCLIASSLSGMIK